MKFWFLLWTLGMLLKRAAKKNPDFQKELEGKDLSFQVITQGKPQGRHFIIKGTQIRSASGPMNEPTFSIAFKDADTGVRIMTDKDKNAFMRGIQEKDIVIEGDFKEVMWFQKIIKYAMAKKKKKAA